MLEETTCEERLRSYTLEDWKPLLDLIPRIETTSKFGEWKGGEQIEEGVFTMPWCMPEPVVSQFLKVIYAIPIMIAFDWGGWDEGRRIANTVDFDLDTVDLVTKCKLITAIARNDRFCEGALVSAFESGLMLRILKSMERELCEQHYL